MGGNQNINELKTACKTVRNNGYKTCLYTGNDLTQDLRSFALKYLDYLKVGNYQADKGGLDSTTTNQIMYDINNGFEDITYKFRRKYNEP